MNQYTITPHTTYDVCTIHYEPREVETDDLRDFMNRFASEHADERHHTYATFWFDVEGVGQFRFESDNWRQVESYA